MLSHSDRGLLRTFGDFLVAVLMVAGVLVMVGALLLFGQADRMIAY